jgi:catechol 2,3-dioxygenase-like lactoylglutathione lyase family enzyme
MAAMKPHFICIDHIQLAAPMGSEDVARNFFGAVCGMEEIPKPKKLRERGGVWFQVGSNELHIGVEPAESYHPNKRAHPAFEVDRLEELRRILTSNGVSVTEGEPLNGAERFYVEAPFGNRLEFTQRTRGNVG